MSLLISKISKVILDAAVEDSTLDHIDLSVDENQQIIVRSE